MRFTDKGIAALKPKAERYEVWEDGRTGLGVRVSPKGRESWVYMYRFDGKARRMGLGTYPLISLASARVKHSSAKEALSKGIDPGAQQVEQKHAERNAETVADLIDEYLEKWAKPRKRSADEDERKLRKEVLPVWGKRKAKDITRRDVIKLLDGIVERGAPIQANRTLAVIRKMFNFALSRDIINATPVAMVKAPAKENQRDRVLSADEMRTFWAGLDEAPMSDGIKLVLKLELVTAQRKGEIAGAAQAEFDFEEGVWTIPAERSMNGKAHRVPLSPLALELIEDAKALADDSDWLFPSPTQDGPITPHAVNRALMKAMRPTVKKPTPAIELEDVTPHDLRRTAASGMTALGINRLVVAKILNHVESGVTAVYDRHGYDAEKRHALDAWTSHLESILSGKPKAENVVSLAAGDVAL
jgi:integrase